ncbi:MAG: hypothetical protein QM791_22870 [Ferruginibacter sp.]
MKKFKIIDYRVSIFLMAACIVTVLVKKDFDFIISAYFIVGGWQVISMIVHAAAGWFTKTWSSRFIYHWITLISIITIPLGSVWILVFTAPAMAIFYTWLCWNEVNVKMKRPLALLK